MSTAKIKTSFDVEVKYEVIPAIKGKPACLSMPGTPDEPRQVEVSSIKIGGQEVVDVVSEKELQDIVDKLAMIEDGEDEFYDEHLF